MTWTMNESEKLMRLYEAMASQKSKNAEAPIPVRERSSDDRATYMREAKRKSRERQRAEHSAGRTEATDDKIREALADAALMLLAIDGPGAAEVRNVLATAFPTRPGVSLTVTNRAQGGQLKPKLITIDMIAAAKQKAEAARVSEREAQEAAAKERDAADRKSGFRRPSFLR